MQASRLLSSLGILILFVSCSTEEPVRGPDSPRGTAAASKSASPKSGAGKVVETMSVGEYTYVRVEIRGKRDWYAVPTCDLQVGDLVTVPSGLMRMENFESRSLDRTFDVIYFAEGLPRFGTGEVATANAVARRAHGAADAAKASAVEIAGITKPDGGVTVAEIWGLGADAAGKEVVLRGKVVKYNSGILGKNWLHVRDGTGTDGTNDITVTTADSCKVGDTVLVTGKIVTDRDFGAGYSYARLIEDAKVTVEPTQPSK